MASQPKVRVACQRCRARRIKCDGQTPQCANCAKADATCVDVDARNAEQLVPRNSASQAKARIEWLEQVIATNLPDFDLSKGPSLESDKNTPAEPATKKRPRELDAPSSDIFATEAQSLAMDLGMLTLSSDSREKQYMGSSSGVFFTHLIQAQSPPGQSPPATASSTQAKSPPRENSVIHRLLITSLPSRDEATNLLDIYVRHVHPDHTILHIPSVLSALNALFCFVEMNPGTLCDAQGWPIEMPPFAYNGEFDSTTPIQIHLHTAIFHIFMVFSLAASIRLQGGQAEFSSAQFYRIAMSVSQDVLGEVSTSGLQATYLLVVHSLLAPSKFNIWIMTHICMAQSIDLGIHRQQKDPNTAANITRSFLFHSIYSLDRSIATIQGRPLSIRDETFDVKFPESPPISTFAASDLEIVASQSVPYILHRFKLDKMISQIKLHFYLLTKSTEIWQTGTSLEQNNMRIALNLWKAEIEQVCSIGRDETQQDFQRRKLDLMYHAAMILLCQPSQAFRHPTKQYTMFCFDAAADLLSCFMSLYEMEMLQFDWRSIRSIFAAGATLIYCFWTSVAPETTAMRLRLGTSLKACSTLLTVGGVYWRSVRKGTARFERLVELTMQRSDGPANTEMRKRRAPASNLQRHHNSVSIPMDHDEAYSFPDVDIAAEASMPSVSNPTTFPPGQGWNLGPNDIPFQYENSSSIPWDTVIDSTPSYGLGTDHVSVLPEVEAFLSDYFLDDPMLNAADSGPPLSFHFGNL